MRVHHRIRSLTPIPTLIRRRIEELHPWMVSTQLNISDAAVKVAMRTSANQRETSCRPWDRKIQFCIMVLWSDDDLKAEYLASRDQAVEINIWVAIGRGSGKVLICIWQEITNLLIKVVKSVNLRTGGTIRADGDKLLVIMRIF